MGTSYSVYFFSIALAPLCSFSMGTSYSVSSSSSYTDPFGGDEELRREYEKMHQTGKKLGIAGFSTMATSVLCMQSTVKNTRAIGRPGLALGLGLTIASLAAGEASYVNKY